MLRARLGGLLRYHHREAARASDEFFDKQKDNEKKRDHGPRPKPDRGLRALLGRLEELTDYGFFNMAESLESLWDSEQPIVIRIHTTQNDNLQKAFASLVFYGLYKDMFRRGIQQRITQWCSMRRIAPLACG
jgi:hypothetical protein